MHRLFYTDKTGGGEIFLSHVSHTIFFHCGTFSRNSYRAQPAEQALLGFIGLNMQVSVLPRSVTMKKRHQENGPPQAVEKNLFSRSSTLF